MVSDRSPDRDQAGPSCAPSDPLPGTFLGLSLDIRSEKLYDLAPDIPDVMGLRALRPGAAIVKVMSVRDSQCIRVVTPDDHVACGFHEILLTIWEKRSCRSWRQVNWTISDVFGRGPYLRFFDKISAGKNARNGLVVHNQGTVHIVASISRWI